MIETKEYTIERLSNDNLADVEKLHAAVYGITLPENYFRKKYNSSYTGVSNIGFIAYNREKTAIAYYGVIPCFIQYENNIILAAQSADTMTHPDHRYKSLFFDLSQMCFELCKQKGIQLVYGFPNQNSYHGAIKLGWQITETMDCFTIPVYVGPFAKVLGKINRNNPLNVLRKYTINKTGLDNSVIKDGFSGVCRDERYLGYKTFSRTYVLQITTSEVWISVKNGLSIGDINIHENDFDETVTVLKMIASKLGIGMIYFHACHATSLHTLFERKFESIPSFPVLFQNFNQAIDIKKIKFTFADIDIF